MRAEATDWSIQEVARLAGTTSRTLRHYDDVGLVPPSRIGANGYRYYDEAALLRLQRVLLLRELGLGIPAIADVIAGQRDDCEALRRQLAQLRQEQERLARQIASVERTIETLEGGEQLMAENMFDGFDHTQYREEVEREWGAEAYATSDAWWRGLGRDGQAAFREQVAALNRDWIAAAASGIDPDSHEAHALAERHVEWLGSTPGIPRTGDAPAKEYVLGLAEMYVADPRFAANYGGATGAAFVRDALAAYAANRLS
mgnify:CR=1 FL=1